MCSWPSLWSCGFQSPLEDKDDEWGYTSPLQQLLLRRGLSCRSSRLSGCWQGSYVCPLCFVLWVQGYGSPCGIVVFTWGLCNYLSSSAAQSWPHLGSWTLDKCNKTLAIFLEEVELVRWVWMSSKGSFVSQRLYLAEGVNSFDPKHPWLSWE